MREYFYILPDCHVHNTSGDVFKNVRRHSTLLTDVPQGGCCSHTFNAFVRPLCTYEPFLRTCTCFVYRLTLLRARDAFTAVLSRCNVRLGVNWTKPRVILSPSLSPLSPSPFPLLTFDRSDFDKVWRKREIRHYRRVLAGATNAPDAHKSFGRVLRERVNTSHSSGRRRKRELPRNRDGI